MDPMDIDEVTVVPDTPDKSAKQDMVRLVGLKSQNFIPSSNIGNSKQFNPPRGIIRSGMSVNQSGSLPLRCGDSSFNRSLSVRKEQVDKGVSHENKNSDNLYCIQNKKPLITSQSSSSPDGPVMDLTGHSKEHVKFFQSNLGSTLAGDFKNGSVLKDGRSSQGRENSPHMLHNGSKERTVSNVVIVDSSPDSVDRQDTFNLRKPSRQKRLVRNGCISPMNIAKGKQPVEDFNTGTTGLEGSDYFLAADTASRDHIPMQNIGDYSSCSSKGKKVLEKNSDGSRELFETSTSTSINKKTNGYSANRDIVSNFSFSDGGKTTHRQSSRHNFLSPLSREVQHIPSEDDSPYIVGQTTGTKALRKDCEDIASIGHLGMEDVISNARPSRQIGGQLRAQSSRTNGRSHKAHTTLSKRQKQGSTLSSHAECSRYAADDSEIIEISSSRKESMSQLTDNLVPNGVGNIGSVINIDEATPESQHISSHSTGSSFSNEDARATQLELDERYARELQEQFYNENFPVGTNEIDTHIALSLQQEEGSRRTVSRGRRPVSNPRGSSSGQSTSPFSLDLGRSGTHTRAPMPSRVTRMRSAFTGRPHTLSSSRGRNSISQLARQRNPVFPPSMDVEARMHILEALETFSDMGVRNTFFQRDFNEDDYEFLLSLDDNNHQHAGATARQINSLPESTVQTESLEEACSICLETPAMGDIIRHLPCFHKFHKDCIDPWLRRRTSCPVCKSSLT